MRQADPGTQSIPVVILTSSREESDLTRGHALVTNSYIQKPVDFDQFRNTIKQLGYYWLLVKKPAPRDSLAASHPVSAR